MSEMWDRRQFLKFMGRGAAILSAMPLVNTLEACTSIKTDKKEFILHSLKPTSVDDLVLADGFEYDVLIKWGDPLNDKGDLFGFNNDYIAYFPDKSDPNSGLLWVNNEYPDPTFISGYIKGKSKRTEEQVIKELTATGGSIVKVFYNKKTRKWEYKYNDPHNRRITGFTPIPIISERPIAQSTIALGTVGNCAGGVTPWGTVLTAEENTIDYFGGIKYISSGERVLQRERGYYYHWQFFDFPPEHYGWIVEVDPKTGDAKKLTGMGRFAHECATVRQAKEGRCVVYSGDDEVNEHLYKFIADEEGSLEKGKLYVANMDAGRWELLQIDQNEKLQGHFLDQTEMLIHTRVAAKLADATPLDKPEDVEVDPVTGAVIVSLTKNIPAGNYYGSLLRLMEKNNDPLALEFTSETFISGGLQSGFACPDNLAFHRNGNLWMTTDVDGYQKDKEEYKMFKNNGLFYIPMSGPDSGIPIQIASAPVDAELTGPWFAEDGKTLFLAVQHPGETTITPDAPTSHWPEGGSTIPKPAVVAISGTGMEALLA